jgi:hypothetical protein
VGGDGHAELRAPAASGPSAGGQHDVDGRSQSITGGRSMRAVGRPAQADLPAGNDGR